MNMKENNYTVYLGYIIIVSLLWSVFWLSAGCTQTQNQIPGPEFDTRGGGSGKNARCENMILIQAQHGSFYIDPFEVSELKRGDFFSVRNQNPKVNVTARQAEEICQSSGKRLCSLQEWRNACLGLQRKRFSYANTYASGTCNSASRGIQPTGYRSRCQNGQEVFDMVGNVMEWVRDKRGDKHIALGGSFAGGKDADCFSAYYLRKSVKNVQTGFRCCCQN